MPVDARNDNTTQVRTCRVCGCSDHDACYHEEHGNCWWVEKDLCSHCKLWPGEAKRWSRIELPDNIVPEAVNELEYE